MKEGSVADNHLKIDAISGLKWTKKILKTIF